MLVEPFYLSPLEEAMERYEKDLCQDQYPLMITPSNFDNPEEIREYLRKLYFEDTQETLIGAILVGDIPYAYQKLTIDFPYAVEGTPPQLQENISMQYYMDLEGEFLLSDEYEPVNGEEPLGEPIFDIHRGIQIGRSGSVFSLPSTGTGDRQPLLCSATSTRITPTAAGKLTSPKPISISTAAISRPKRYTRR